MMTMIDDELRAVAKNLRARAVEAETRWREERGLSKGLHRAGNAKAAKRRERAECPRSSKAAKCFARWRERRLGKFGAASRVRRVDPQSGEVI